MALRSLVLAGALAGLAGSAGAQGGTSVPLLKIQGDAVPQALSETPGDPARGRAIVANRQVGLCLLCHTGPIPEERFQGTLAPDLAGAGRRWSAGQLRLRVADAQALNPESIMPPYFRSAGLNRVAAAWRDKPVLNAQQVEDVVAYLVSLRD